MVNVFEPIVAKKGPFADYIQYIFEQKESFIVGSRKRKISGLLMNCVQNCSTPPWASSVKCTVPHAM